MNEYTATKILECLDSNQSVPNYILENYIVSSCSLLDHEYGPKSKELSMFLDAVFACTNASEKPAFSLGAVHGALYFYKVWREHNELH
jgi:hypothetical protein